MASNDTAALVVALSAQVSKFEKDMQSAVSIADKKTKEIETRFTAMNAAIQGKLSELGSTASSNLGFAGTLLRTLGPAGLAAAVGIGAAVGGILSLADAASQFAEKSKRLKEGAEIAGLTISQFKLLGQAGSKVGLDFDETAGFFTKFISNIEALRQGGGPLYDALLKIDTGLLRQLSVAKDSATAIDILISAYKRLSDQSQKLDLAKAAGGKGGLTAVTLLDNLGKQDGLAGLQANAPKLDEGQIERAAKLKVEIDEIAKKTQNIWGSMFSDAILTHQRDARFELQQLSEWLSKIIQGRITLDSLGPIDPLADAGRGKGNRLGVSSGVSVPTFADRFAPAERAPLGAPPPKGSTSVELAILQKNIALLGEAATQTEQLRLKELELAAATEKGGVQHGIATRALDAFKVAMVAAATATRERLGVATEQQIVEARLAQLAQDRTKFNLSENEVLRAKNVILLEAKQAADALAVRQSYLPGLKQLELDALSVRRGLDTLATNSLGNLENALVDVVSGTKTASEAFKAMANAIIADLARIAIRQAITGPLAGALGGLFGGGTSNAFDVNNGFVPSVNGGGIVPRFAGGTSFAPGGAAWVGENGPELINLPRGSQVIPNDIVRGMGGGVSMTNQFNIHMDAAATSADPATAASNARAMRKELEGLVEQTIQKNMRSGGLLSA